MNESPFLIIRERQNNINTRIENLKQKQIELNMLLVKQDAILVKSNKNYVKFISINEVPKNHFEPIFKNIFEKELDLLNKQFELIVQNTNGKNEKQTEYKEYEKYILNSIELFRRRWNSIIVRLNKLQEEKNRFIKQELEFENEYVKLESIDSSQKSSNWINRSNELSNNHLSVIEVLERILEEEEELYYELELYIQKRAELIELQCD